MSVLGRGCSSTVGTRGMGKRRLGAHVSLWLDMSSRARSLSQLVSVEGGREKDVACTQLSERGRGGPEALVPKRREIMNLQTVAWY